MYYWVQSTRSRRAQLWCELGPFLSKSRTLTRALMRSGELRVLMRGWPKGPPLRIFKSKSRSSKNSNGVGKISSNSTGYDYVDFIFWPVTSEEGQKWSKKVKMYWFTVANCLSRKTNLPNKMELNKHKYHRNDLGVASWACFEVLWRHKRGQYWPIRGQLGESHEPAVVVKIQTAVKRHHIILSKATPWPYLIHLLRHSDVTVTSKKVTAYRITAVRGGCHEKDTWPAKVNRV